MIFGRLTSTGQCFGESDEAGVKVIVRNSRGEVKATLAEKNQKATISGRVGVFGCLKSYTFFSGIES